MALPVPSSPLSSPPPTQSISREASASQEGKQYRPTKELSFELAQHVQTYLEEGLFTQAFSFLLSITGNSVSSINRLGPVNIPPPSHLAVAATLAVHPITTTRTASREKWDQANSALRLLKLVNSLVGPVNANFTTAFHFRKFDFRFSRRSDKRIDNDEEEGQESAFDDNDLNTTYARSHSLWTRAEDFWQLVGWVFNCACLPGVHAARWTHYRLLLEFLIDVLEKDWQMRTTGMSPSPEESLLWQYIELSAGGHARERRILRAVFADGSPRSLGEFRETFAHELKEPEKEAGTAIKKREVDVNIDQDVYGDYMGNDEEDLSDGGGENCDDGMSTGSGRPAKRLRTRRGTPSSRGVTPRSSTGSLRSAYTADGDGESSSSAHTLGDATSVALRLHLLRLLTYVASHPTLTATSPTTFPDLDDLLLLFVEFIRPLSLPIFAQIVLPSPSNPLDPATLTNLCEAILQRTLEHSAPSRKSHMLLSQKKLEEEYLQFAASKNSIDANARVSMLLEGLMRSLTSVNLLEKTKKLVQAVEKGVEKRAGRVADLVEKKGGKKKGKRQGEEVVAWEWLVESGQRMLKVVEVLEEE